MVDKSILWSKVSALQKHIDRVRAKREVSLHVFKQDLDRQESVLFNLQMAIQNCVGLAGIRSSSRRTVWLIKPRQGECSNVCGRFAEDIRVRDL